MSLCQSESVLYAVRNSYLLHFMYIKLLIRRMEDIGKYVVGDVRENGKRSTVKVDSSDIPSKYIRSDASSKAHRSV